MSDQTPVSRILTSMDRIEWALAGAIVISLVGLVTGLYPAMLGLWLGVFAFLGEHYLDNRGKSASKWGSHQSVDYYDDGSGTGYTIWYVAGYEVYRRKDFEVGPEGTIKSDEYQRKKEAWKEIN